MLELIQENNVIIGIIIGIITLFITMRQIIISNQKHRMDKEDFISKRPNFSVYIENCYRISYNSSKHTHAVFCITIKIDYIENGIIRTIKLSHDKNLFHKKYHSQIEKYDNNIRLEPKDIKYGWVIFQIPEILKNRRIERYRIIVQDVENNVSKAESLLIKEIHYDD